MVEAPAEAVFALILDYERTPVWQRSVRSARVVARDEQGRGLEVAYEVDVRVATVHYTLRHSYDPPREISSAYVTGDFRDCRGRWTFDAQGPEATKACFELYIDPGRAIPRPVVKMLNARVMKGTVEDLRRHFQA